MPKQKTNRGTAKRFKRTGTGGLKHRATNRNHILTKKKMKRKRHLRGMAMVAECDLLSLNRLLKVK